MLEVAAFVLGHEEGEFVLFNTVLTAPSTAMARACSRDSPHCLKSFDFRNPISSCNMEK